ncbi:MAG TPA: carbamoyltransferase HypF [Vicinamibacteria bacterium]|nr:carbamoyltransferase HypF [Vicinamibacteria bacterium]
MAAAPLLDERRRLRVRGSVQGVGFRPFVYRLARSLGLGGFVENSTEGVTIEIEGRLARLDEFRSRLGAEPPPRAVIAAVETETVPSRSDGPFRIRDSATGGPRTAAVLPDFATCDDCRREVFDPSDRRHLYPFTNCTSCGPRYSIVLDLPYDRARTTMAGFAMCERCRREYEDPGDRRFHAEPIACPACGPQLEARDAGRRLLGARHEALLLAAAALRGGCIVAVKGIGGFHLFCDARDEEAVRTLRRRKERGARPLAVMAPSLEWARAACLVDDAGERLLTSPEAPIVLLPPSGATAVARSVARGSPSLGIMLPYSPLHHLLMRELGFPVVATSGNLADEPMCTGNEEAFERLATVASLFLVHDRPIAHRVDDSVARPIAGRPMLLRRARGYAPAAIAHVADLPSILAYGGHQKNTVALAVGPDVVLGPHVGDLDAASALAGHRDAALALRRFHRIEPGVVACDLHPDYASTHEAWRSGARVIEVQHHHAHVLSAMADLGLEPPVLGFAWDGSGYGTDGTVWGGETLLVRGPADSERLASFHTFPLPGGERAVREPRRAALGALFAAIGDAVFADPGWRRLGLFRDDESLVLGRMLARGLNCPLTSSVGRLFDAVAALAGLHARADFEGQAAMALEAALPRGRSGVAPYPFALGRADAGPLVVDWRPALLSALEDAAAGRPASDIAQAFHRTLAGVIVAVAESLGARRALLTGGCFQNRALTEGAVAGLRRAGIEPLWHERIPPNDGGLAAGQLLAAAHVLQAERA